MFLHAESLELGDLTFQCTLDIKFSISLPKDTKCQ